MERERCFTCGRKMYRVEAGKASPSEWRHDSSGHAVSWMPDRHIAGTSALQEHQHQWSKPTKDGWRQCTVTGCDTDIIDMKPPPAAKPTTEREVREQRSRLRGASARGNRPPRQPEIKQPS